MKKTPLKALVATTLAAAMLSSPHVTAQNTQPPIIISSTNAAVTLNAASDNYEILAGSILTASSGNGVIIGGAATTPWFVKNAGSVTHSTNSGMYFSYDAVITNSAEGLISSANSTASHAGIYFTTAGAGSIENSGTILGGLKGINFGNTARLNTVVNNAGALIMTSVNATNGGAVYSANNNTVSVTNAGYIWGALRGLHLGGASTVLNTGTIRGDSGTAIIFNSTAVSSTLTLDTGSEIIGDIVSNAGLLNHIILAGSGSEDNSFIGVGGDTTKGFSTLLMDGANWTLSGTIHLTNATANALTVTAGRLTIAGDTILATAGGAVTIASGGTLQIGDNSTTGSLVNPTLGAGIMPDIINNGAFAISRSDDITLTNAISGAGVIVQAGSGVLSLAGNNTHTGGVRIDSGTLAIADDSKLGATTGALTLNGGVARFDATFTTARALELAAGGTIDTNGNTITLTGAVYGPGDLVKIGGGLLELTGANTSTGATTILSGTLQGNIGSGLLTVDTGATYKVAAGTLDAILGNIAGAGIVDLNNANLVFNVATGTQTYGFAGTLQNGGNLRKTGAGALDIGAHSFAGELSATGTTFVEDGTLIFDSPSQIGANLLLGSATTKGLIQTDFSTWTQNLLLTGAGGGISIVSGSQALSITIAGSGDFVKAGAGTLDITGATMSQSGNTQIQDGKLVATIATLIGNTDIATDATLELNEPANATYAGNITGGGSLIKNGLGETTLTGANTYAGDTTINAGTLSGNIGQGTLTVNTGATYKVADGVTDFSISGILGAGTINLNTANLTLNVATGASIFNFAGALTGGNQLIKTGAGTIELQTAAALTNGVAVKNGTLKLADQSFVNAPITLGDTVTHGMIEYTGATAWNRAVTLTGAGGGFTVSTGTQNLAAGAAISGAGDFIKDGAGALDITAASMTNTGNTRIDAGKLIANLATLIGNTDIATDATLELNQPTDGSHAGNITGGGSLIKSGLGELVLTGANTYAGDTTINAGTLSGNIGQGTLTVNSGATYKVADGVTDFSLSGILGSGTINLNAASLTLHVDSGVSVFNYTGALTGGNQLIKTGAGAIELQTAAALTNGVAIKNGTLKLADQSFVNAPITLGDTATHGMIEYTGATAWSHAVTLTGMGGGFTVSTGTQTLAITVAGTGDFVKAGAGALDITAASMTQNGNTRIDAGKLIANTAALNGNTNIATGAILELNQIADGSYAGNITGGGSLIKNGLGEAILTGANTYAGDTTINAGTLSGNIGQGTLTVNSGATYKVADGVTDFSLSGILGSGTINLNAASLTFNVASGTSIFNFEGELTGGDQIIKTGAGTVELQTAAALTNGVTVKNGTLKLADQSFINAPITLGDTTSIGMIQYTGTDPWAKNIALTGSGGGFNVASGTQTLATDTAITGAGNFIKTGSGALDITAAATDYTGNTLVQAGRLIGSASTIRGNAALSASTVLEFNQAIDGAYSGNISGAGSLVKSGAGILALTGSNTQTGSISLLEGALSGNTNALRVSIATSASTAVIFDQAADGAYSAAVTGSGALVKDGAGKLTLTSANRQTGGTRINAGALQISSTNLTGAIENNATLIFEQPADGTYAGIITGTGQLQKSGGGTLTLSGSSTYSGATLITQGTLRASAANRLSPNSNYNIFGSLASLDLNGADQTIAGLANTGALIFNATINPDAGLIVSANRLNVRGDASGDGKIIVRITESGTATTGVSERTLVKIDGVNTATYTGELDKRYVDGAYEWAVMPGADGQSFVLRAGQLSPEVPATISLPAIAQFMAKAGIDTRAQRLGDLNDGSAEDIGFWFRGIYREDRIDEALLDGMKVRTGGGQAGVSWRRNGIFSDKGSLDLGVFLTMVEANATYKTLTDLKGDAKEIGAFATYRVGGWYADLVLNVAHNRYTVKMRDDSDSFNFTGWGPTAALETGWQFANPRLGVFEPQLQIAYQYCQIGESSDAFQRNYTVDSTDMLNAHAGLRWHKVYALGRSGALIPALRVRYGHEFLGDSRVRVAGADFKSELGGSQRSIDGGLSWWFNRGAGMYANVGWASGKSHNGLSATAGIRLSW